MWTSAARNALALRTTVPMLKSCSQFSIATWNPCRRVSRSATIASTVQYRYRSTTLRRSPSARSSGSSRGSSGRGRGWGPTPTGSARSSVIGGQRATHLGADAGRDEHHGRVRCAVDQVGGVPDAGVVDDRLAGGDRDREVVPSGALLGERDGAGDAQHEFAPVRVHLPRVPRLAERVHRHEAALEAVGGVLLAVLHVPRHVAGVPGQWDRRRAQPQMHEVAGRELDHLAHPPSSHTPAVIHPDR